MLIDVLMAGVIGLILMGALLELTVDTLELNQLATQAAVAHTLLIDLESHMRLVASALHDPSELGALTTEGPLCESAPPWAQTWCQRLAVSPPFGDFTPRIVLEVEGERFDAALELSGSSRRFGLSATESESPVIRRSWSL